MDHLKEILSAVAIVVSIISFIVSYSATRRDRIESRKDNLQSKIWELYETLLGNEILKARRCMIESPEVVSIAFNDYSSESRDKSYLNNEGVIDAIKRGAAEDLDDFMNAYSAILSSIARAASIAPTGRGNRRLKKVWRKETVGIYGSIRDLVLNLESARNEIYKINPLWWPPMDAEHSVYSDKVLFAQIEALNKVRGSDVPEIQTPSTPYSAVERQKKDGTIPV